MMEGEHERTTPASDQYAAGHKYANTVADIITKQFPPGIFRSTRFVRRKLRKMTNESLIDVINALVANGIDAALRRAFQDGFIIRLKERDPELASYVNL